MKTCIINMFDWIRNKKTFAESGILTDFVDFHSHVLPGVDDGIKNIEEALGVLHAYENLGVRKVVFTPHIMEEYPQNDALFLRSQFEAFKKLYNGNIEISLGAEYMLNNQFSKYLDSGDLLPVVDNYLLIETAFSNPPIYFEKQLKMIQSKGYFPILAHPERYMYMEKADYQNLKDMGVLFQMNLLSIIGGYGRSVERKAKELLYAGMYDCLGTDIHQLNYHIREITHRKLGRKEIKFLSKLKQGIGRQQ